VDPNSTRKCRSDRHCISHEIRSPLGAVLGYTELLNKEVAGPLNGRQRLYVTGLQTSSAHLLNIVNDILDLSRLESGRFRVHATTGHLGEVIERALTLVRPQSIAKNIQLTDDTSGVAGDAPFCADVERVIPLRTIGTLVRTVRTRSDHSRLHAEYRPRPGDQP
jgi:two-component system cell cycle sensor histidine kinase PleC